MRLLQEEQLLTRYLLGELPAEEVAELEERLCREGEQFERMLAHGDDLIDDYLAGRLSASQRRSFERHFLNLPGQRERFEMARALQAVFAAEREAQPSPAEQHAERQAEATIAARVQPEPSLRWRWLRDLWRGQRLAFAAALVVTLFFLAGLSAIFYSWGLSSGSNQARAERAAAEQQLQEEIVRERERADQLELELRLARQPNETPSPNPQPPPSDLLASVNLSSDFIGGDRGPGGSGGGKLVVPSGAGWVQLRLQLRGDDYRGYRVTIRASSSGQLVWRQSGLPALTGGDGKAVIVTLPASRLVGAAKNYLVTLDGRTAEGNYEGEVDRYSFQVEKR